MGLGEAYDRAASIIGPQRTESFEAALEAERLRLAWKPQDLRVVILAESHVWTSRTETLARVTQPDGVKTGFARFVYCLGNGEPSLVLPQVSPNRPTPQFWRLFHDAVRGPDVPLGSILKQNESNPTVRVMAKLALLRGYALSRPHSRLLSLRPVKAG